MTWAERGLYRELLDECWIKGRLPSTVEGIAALLDVDLEEIEPHFPAVVRCFDVLDDGTMVSPVIESIRTEADAYRLQQKELAEKREAQRRSARCADEQLGAQRCENTQLAPPEQNRTEQNRTEKDIYTTKEAKPDPQIQQWIERLREMWPKNQHDGTSAPLSPKAEVYKRATRILKAKEATAEELAFAGLAYTREMVGSNRYIKALVTFLGPQEVWKEYLPQARDMISCRVHQYSLPLLADPEGIPA